MRNKVEFTSIYLNISKEMLFHLKKFFNETLNIDEDISKLSKFDITNHTLTPISLNDYKNVTKEMGVIVIMDFKDFDTFQSTIKRNWKKNKYIKI
jgi:hypothetical protein